MIFTQTLEASWQRRTLLGWMLLPVSLLFALLVALRRLAYRQRLLAAERLPVPVLVVGNVVAGGSGKTPVVIWLVERLRARGRKPGVVSRGYGGSIADVREVLRDSKPADVGDEALLIKRRIDCPVFVGKDRPAAARALLDAYPDCDIIVSDDGLQHYRLARDLELAVVDRRGAGNGWPLPAGPLREPLCRLQAVDAVILNGRESPPVSGVRSFAMRVVADACVSLGDPHKARPLAAFSGMRVHALAGIGEPQRFFNTLAASAIDVIPHPFPDHHAYVPADLVFGDDLPVLMTEKDAVKCAGFCVADAWMVPVSAEIDPALLDLLLEKLDGSQAA